MGHLKQKHCGRSLINTWIQNKQFYSIPNIVKERNEIFKHTANKSSSLGKWKRQIQAIMTIVTNVINTITALLINMVSYYLSKNTSRRLRSE